MSTTHCIGRERAPSVESTSCTSIADLMAVAGLDLARWVTKRCGLYGRNKTHDLTQEVWLRALQLASTGKAQCYNRTWLFGVAKHVLLEQRRAAFRNTFESLCGEIVTTHPDAVATLIHEEESQAVERCLGRLGEHQRELILASLRRGQHRRSSAGRKGTDSRGVTLKACAAPLASAAMAGPTRFMSRLE